MGAAWEWHAMFEWALIDLIPPMGPSLAHSRPIFNHKEIKILLVMGLKPEIMVLLTQCKLNTNTLHEGTYLNEILPQKLRIHFTFTLPKTSVIPTD